MISVRSEVQVFPGPPRIRSGGSGFRLPTSPPWGCSSVGRAPALQAGGHRFDPVQLHQDGARRPRSAPAARPGIRLMGCDIRFWPSRKRGVRRAPLATSQDVASSPRWRGAMFDMVKRLCGRGGGPAGLPVRHAVGRKLGKSEPSCASGLVPVRDTDAEIKRLKGIWWMPWH